MEKQELVRKLIELEEKLDAKEVLNLKIECCRLILQVEELKLKVCAKKVHALQQELKEKEEELAYHAKSNIDLILKERKSNKELQDARKELIHVFAHLSSPAFSKSHIGIKRMGELDGEAFVIAARRKYSKEEAVLRAAELWSLWEDYLREPEWYPFRIVRAANGNGDKIIIDEEDEKVKRLRNGFGEETCQAVTTALMEMNEYNSSGMYVIPDKDDRRATLKEGVLNLMNQWSLLKKKRPWRSW